MKRPNSHQELLPIVVQEQNVLVDARLLHQQLKSGYQYTDWIKRRIEEFGFKENLDFFASEISEAKRGGHNRVDYLLSLDMAKELAMLERNEIGRQVRLYFIEQERKLRGISHLPKQPQLFKGIKPVKMNNHNLYPYADILERSGSNRHSGSSRKARYPQHFVLMGRILHVTEEMALHIYHQKQVFNNRVALRAMQPVLPADFASPIKTEGGVQ